MTLSVSKNYNIHINRELSDEELQYIVELLNENSYQNIIVDFYDTFILCFSDFCYIMKSGKQKTSRGGTQIGDNYGKR